MRKFRCAMIAVGAAVGLAMAGSEATAGHRDGPYVRGEVERLLRQSYDYYYRNSNNNVFRNSRHFHPTRNVFRSSRHYKQRLAASYDGYPLRSTLTFSRRIGDGPAIPEQISIVHPRRHPQGATGIGYDLLPSYRVSPGLVDPYLYDGPYRVIVPRSSLDPEPILRKDEPRDRDDIEMRAINVNVERHEPTQRAVIRTVTRPDGTAKTIIASVPIERAEPSNAGGDPSIDDGWRRLAVGEYEGAAEAFKARSLDDEGGAEAMLGYGLAMVMLGEYDKAAVAIERAAMIDSEIGAKAHPDRATVLAIRAILDRSDHDGLDDFRASAGDVLGQLADGSPKH